MDYNQATEILFNSLPVFQFSGAGAYKPGLARIEALDQMLGYPHRNYATIHVGGTNGKGSTSHMLASVLQASGLRVGLYTSPHLKDFRERIRVNGEMISEEDVIGFVEDNIDFAKSIDASFFEITAAMAFKHFELNSVDVAIIEVGLGGRLDATNIITPQLSIITNIGLDHTQFLGSTIEAIAAEKAGIIKPRVPVIIAEGAEQIDPIFESCSQRMDAPILFAEDIFEVEEVTPFEQGQNITLRRTEGTTPCRRYRLSLDLMGLYQKSNLRGVIVAIETLNNYYGYDISTEDIEEGVANVVRYTGLQGRWQQLSEEPLIVCDTGHNAHGMAEIAKQISLQSFERLYMVLGMVNDKDISSALRLLPKQAHYIFTQAAIERAMPAEELHSAAIEHGLHGEVVTTVCEAVERAKSLASSGDMIYIGGSNFVVAEVL